MELWQPLALHFDRTAIEAVAVIDEKIGSALMKMKTNTDASREYKHAIEIAEAIGAANPNIPEAQYALADGYFANGELSRMIASDVHSRLQDQIRNSCDARNWYQRAAKVWQTINNPTARTPVGWACGNPRKVAAELASCENTLLRLRKQH